MYGKSSLGNKSLD